MYKVMHVGYPVAGRPIREGEWNELSSHETESAAWKKVKACRAHLEGGQWNDHYIVLDPDGNKCDYEYWLIKVEAAATMGRLKSPKKSAASRANGKLGGRPKKSEQQTS